MSLLLLLAIAGVGVAFLVVVLTTSRRGVTEVRLTGPSGKAPADYRQLARAGRKIEAIKLYREATGVGLKEAKDPVEALERGEAPVVAASAPPSSVLEEIRMGRKINAIKLYREQHGAGLKEAKDAVDALEAEERAKGMLR